MEDQIIDFALETETKGTYRYQEVEGEGPMVVGTLYVRKNVVGKPPPRRLRVTIEEAEEP